MMLEEKISNEFQRYFLSMMATSKDNIFAHSNEIETKKQIKKELLKHLTLSRKNCFLFRTI